MTDNTLRALVVPADAAEVVDLPAGGAFTLLADARDTAGALGANQLTLGPGREGAKPHYHALSTELFYVLNGAMEFLLGEEVATVTKGGLVVVPPRLPHAFGAVPGVDADLLAVLTPGVERFGYFRQLARIQHGLEPFDGLLPEQERYDVHFVDAADWQSMRSSR
ncbi:cupin domain-containing protein [Streptosporangium sp. NBC_01756]|uniref:cupin domain-containing protein n=1 Tax=Streptosporangium sp. NBC_01756 TaxID=2975950 RepID=UPI002DDBF0D5|nr:cupin domain-containing protein [Streptosporangium sp. NBC_01756]WSC88949.1 cupin domain-containing protein [Streptosporangium sp. NBC_01756]